VVLEPLEFAQQYRHFALGLPWLRRPRPSVPADTP
jgi:hypothetical protein